MMNGRPLRTPKVKVTDLFPQSYSAPRTQKDLLGCGQSSRCYRNGGKGVGLHQGYRFNPA